MADAADFYVGYLPMPRRLARFMAIIVPMVLAGALALSWSVSRSQANPGDGVWQDDADTLVGRLAASPYPLIRIPTTQPGRPVDTVLLVSEGKHGGGERAAALDGRIARVRGTILERDGLRLLELADGNAGALEELSTTTVPASVAGLSSAPAAVSLGHVTLRGEIIDPKCYTGAMKPGEGKTHKECATLCLAGGIPPMFVTLDDAGRHTYYLLTDAAGRGLTGDVLRDRILPFVADAVEVSGELVRHDDLLILRLDLERTKRL